MKINELRYLSLRYLFFHLYQTYEKSGQLQVCGVPRLEIQLGQAAKETRWVFCQARYPWDGRRNGWISGYGNDCYIAIENDPFIVDIPIQHGGSFQFVMQNVYQAG